MMLKYDTKKQVLGTLVVGLLLLLWTSNACAEQPPPSMVNAIDARYSAQVDWNTRILTFRITAPVDSGNKVRNMASLISRKEDELRQFFPSIFPLGLHGIRIDSQNLLGDKMRGDPVLSLGVQQLSEKALLVKSTPSRNLDLVSVEYELALFPTLSGFLFEERGRTELERLLSWQASADYTGIVLYAKERTLRYGSDQKDSLVPCLFPKIFDEDRRLILDTARMDPRAARTSGPMEYRSSIDEVSATKVGKKPLVITVRALYGDVPTDVMISRADADILLYNQSTRDALVGGKVATIVDSQSLKQALVD